MSAVTADDRVGFHAADGEVFAAALRDVAAAEDSLGRRQPTLQVLMPVIAAFVVLTLSALAAGEASSNPSCGRWSRHRACPPEAAPTTAVLVRAAGQINMTLTEQLSWSF